MSTKKTGPLTRPGRDSEDSANNDKLAESTASSNIQSGKPDLLPSGMANDELGKYVSKLAEHICERLDTLEPYVRELQARFNSKKSKTVEICGCKTWNEYCDKVLGRSRRAVNYMLAGGNPGTHHPTKSPGGKPFPTQTYPNEQYAEDFIRAGAAMYGRPDPTPTLRALEEQASKTNPPPRAVVDPLQSVTIIPDPEPPPKLKSPKPKPEEPPPMVAAKWLFQLIVPFEIKVCEVNPADVSKAIRADFCPTGTADICNMLSSATRWMDQLIVELTDKKINHDQ